jgi:NAD(P)-dependent dehydrogenase (short-subunit alcohol dehydrogenase family)
MSYQKVILILGAGPNIGQHVARAFAAKGYKVAVASRRVKEENIPDQVSFQVDLTNPSSVSELFTKVKETLGIPSVVVYNGEHPLLELTRHATIKVCMLIESKPPQPPPMTPRNHFLFLWKTLTKI